MNHVIKLGLLSSVLSATLFADIKVESNATVISKIQTDIALKLTDSETNKPIVSNVKFAQLGVDKGSQIGTMEVLSDGQYAFSITRTAGCNKAKPEIKGVFSATINGKKVEKPYTICEKTPGIVETQHPYKNNEKVEMIIENTAFGVIDDPSTGYYIRIFGETEANYDFVTFTDMSGKVLEGRVLNDENFGYKVRKLRFSGNFSKKNVRRWKGGEKVYGFFAQDATYIFIPYDKYHEGKPLKVKILFTSDSSDTKEGVKIDMHAARPM